MLYGQNYGYDINQDDFTATEEEKRRRQEALGQLVTGAPISDVTENYMNQIGQNVNNRFDQLADTFQGPAQPIAPDQLAMQMQANQIAQQPAIEERSFNQPMPSDVIMPTMPTQITEPAMPTVEAMADMNAIPQEQAMLPEDQVAALKQGQVQVQAQPTNWQDDVMNLGNDTQQLAQYMSNPNNPKEGRDFAGRMIARQYQQQTKEQEAERTVNQAAKAGDLLPLLKRIEKEKGEGSYVKAYLYSRLGLNELAKEEQQKLGAGTTFQVAYDQSGNKALMEVTAQGMPVRGYNEKMQELTPEEFGRFAVGAQPKAGYLMPQVHGTPVSKVDERGQLIGGMRIYDPVTRQAYVQVGTQRLPDVGWTTTTNVPQVIYTGAAAKEQGTAAGKGFTPQPTPGYPGGYTPFAPGQTQPTEVAPNMAELDKNLRNEQTNLQALQTEIAKVPRTNTARINDLNNQIQQTTTRIQQIQGAIGGLGGKGVPSGGVSTGQPIYKQEQQARIQQAEQEERIKVAGQRSQSFNKILDEEVRPQAQAGDTVSSVRKQQFAIFDRPGIDVNKLFGLYNASNENPNDQKLSIVRDIFGGIYKPEIEVSNRLAQLNLTPAEKSALQEYNIANQRINAATLKQTAGPGSVSDAEQKLNRESNVDPTKIPALGAYNAMAQSQFSGDLARYKGDWADKSNATNALQLDKLWRKESQKYTQIYTDIAKKRIEFITKNGSTTNAVREGYKRYPVPEYDPNTEKWNKLKPLGEILGR